MGLQDVGRMRALCLFGRQARKTLGSSPSEVNAGFASSEINAEFVQKIRRPAADFRFRQGESVGFERCACLAAWVNGKEPVFIPLGGFLDVHKRYPSYAHYGSFL
ncbi:hypothetical protein [Cardiobacterium valvarum]|uniref:hypothetical protein n=1 Tax=Cardiobacterium valvarum TaxID=194702 RepID=UPI0011C04033|nr:hypothetical protein [Cardiobacterium valvarum]